MADWRPYTDSNSDTGDEMAGTPRWVKVFGMTAIILVLLFVILMFIRGAGGHTPSRHFGGQAPPEARHR